MRLNAGRLPLLVLAIVGCGRPTTGIVAPLTFGDSLAAAAVEQTRHPVRYDPSYRRLAYPGGDVPDSLGVCTDVIIRACRRFGIDLQQEVHEDILLDPDAYGISRPDPSIDHRRVPVLCKYFARRGSGLAVTQEPADYLPGDIVAWELAPGLTHIGMVVGRGRVVHNIGAGPKLENVLFSYRLIGHHRFGRQNLAD